MYKRCWIVLACTLSGCAFAGKDDLIAQGSQTHVEVVGDHSVVAQCITATLDSEKPKMFELPAPVSRAMPSPDGKSIELISTVDGVNSILNWTAVVRQINQDQSSISLITRRNVNPYLSDHYLSDKLLGAIAQCSKPISAKS